MWRRRYVIRFAGVGGVLLVALVIEMLVLNHLAGRSWWWPPGLALALGPVVLLLVVALVAWKRQRNGRLRPLMEQTDPAEARRVSKALRRGTPLPAGTGSIAQILVDLTASRPARQRVFWTFVVAAVLFLANFFVQEGRWRWFYVIGAAGYALGAVWARRGNPRLLANAALQGIRPSAPQVGADTRDEGRGTP
ncbi:hypothetical protein SAMN04488544_0729 [Microlunatus sagamiharensis]|uniref:Uncharacterized protein n=2 Tax=Microlunatus sagamiharensis TaxID=546874 RepID=A0A1H2LSZ4_9ACTN|nr:hypothetical protein SAMN04488544_0729 [Microlunatus sagamiharensis]